MWINIKFADCLTLGELRELVNSGTLSEFPDTTSINICTDVDNNNGNPILHILGDEDSVIFYNYI